VTPLPAIEHILQFDLARQSRGYGREIDAKGSAVAGINVHYIFYTSTNPVITSVWLQYGLPTSQVVTLKIFDPFDRKITTLIDGRQQPTGQPSILFDSFVNNGVYSPASILAIPFEPDRSLSAMMTLPACRRNLP